MPSPLLDNAVWHSLHTVHAPFRDGDVEAGAVRFPPDVSIFSGLPDEPAAEHWEALAALVGPGGVATLFRGEVAEPDGWERALTVMGRQMVAVDVDGQLDPEVVPLGTGDAAAMVALAERTKPGPFGPRTVELGGYVGVRDESGRLVAMAGHRLRMPGFVELSAVCTDESARGRGLASRLVRHVVASAAEDGDTVFLHAMVDNTSAIRLYESLGFEHRRTVEAAALLAPAPSAGAAQVASGDVALDACRVTD